MQEYMRRPMVMLAGEQAAPNLLPARCLEPAHILILHTDLAQSETAAKNLRLRMGNTAVTLQPIAAYDPNAAAVSIQGYLREYPQALVNITGGTKPMSIAALIAAKAANCTPFYVRSQQAQTILDFYNFDEAGIPWITEALTIEDTISIDDHLTVYFGQNYHFTGFGDGPGRIFEEAIFATLDTTVDEVRIGWKHKSGAVDVDFIVRCNNQIGIIEAKSGNRAASTEGIKQLAVAGGQRFFGTYTKRILVVDQDWTSKRNNQELAKALGIVLVELPRFAALKSLGAEEQRQLSTAILNALGKPINRQVAT